MYQRLWRPLLTGDLRQRACRVVERIVEGHDRLQPSSNSTVPDLSLAGGKAGEALFWAYLSRSAGREAMAERAIDCLEASAVELAQRFSFASLYGGFSGTGWVAEHFRGWLVEEGTEDFSQGIDEALLRYLDHYPWTGDYDLIGGLVGFGVYALERLPTPTARACLEHVVEHLAELAVEQPSGRTWLTPNRLLHMSQAPDYPDGYYNLGLAHGVPGVIAILAAACRENVRASTARRLLDGAVAWLLSARLEGGLLPTVIAPDQKPLASRLAWCYGNPGVAVALLAAARCVGERLWEEEALEIARTAARLPVAGAGVQDAGLCHGSAGLGHLFNSLHQVTGDEVCGEAARVWLSHTLDSMRPDDWTIGFPSRVAGADGQLELREHAGLLTGVAGIGLALLAATTSIAPDWDRFLLVSLPPIQAAR